MATSTSSLPEVAAVSVKRKPNPKVLLAIAGVAVASFLGWKLLVPPPPSNVLHVSGRIEADETDIGAKTGGRIAAILVREGDSVKAGQVVAEIVDEEVNAQLQGAIAQVAAAKQDAAQAKLDIQVANSRIQEAEATVIQAQNESRGRVNQSVSTVSATKAQVAQAQAQVAEAQAGIKQAEARLKLAQVDRDRYADLVAQGAINRQQFDQAQTNADTTQATLDTARATFTARIAAVQATKEQLAASQGSLTQSQSSTLNPTIRNSQLSAYQQQKQQAAAKLAAAEAKVKNAQAAQSQLQKRLDSFKVRSPIDGVVQNRPLEPGAIVATGKTLLTVLNPQAVYLRGYVPEGDVGKIYPGKPARVFLDSNLKQPLRAKVSAIDPKASFTPENIYFQKDRVRQVFGIKLAIEQSQGYAKPGMPADAEIDIKP
ncbi:MAG: hypothetical protein DCF22_15040 [Leptolyngbya sp.]|nr:MAG: hypothetical protein DCF22_15040 [Leptolyngbya sp.]